MHKDKVHTEKGIRQRDSVDFRHGRVVNEIRVNEKEYGHVHRLPSIESLLFEAKALDLTEVGCNLRRCDAVCSHPDDIFVALVSSCVEGQCSFPR